MSEPPERGIFATVRQMLGGASGLVAGLAGLLVAEVRAASERAVRRLVIAAIAVVVAAGGALMIVAAAGVALGRRLGDPWLGVALVGLVAIVGGIVVALVVGRRIVREDLSLPITRAELEKDLQWLRDQRSKS
jgi:uncharacterized membrane protein YqjE